MLVSRKHVRATYELVNNSMRCSVIINYHSLQDGATQSTANISRFTTNILIPNIFSLNSTYPHHNYMFNMQYKWELVKELIHLNIIQCFLNELIHILYTNYVKLTNMYNFQHKERNSIYFIPFIWINIIYVILENLDDNTCRNLNYNNLNKLVIITRNPSLHSVEQRWQLLSVTRQLKVQRSI